MNVGLCKGFPVPPEGRLKHLKPGLFPFNKGLDPFITLSREMARQCWLLARGRVSGISAQATK